MVPCLLGGDDREPFFAGGGSQTIIEGDELEGGWTPLGGQVRCGELKGVGRPQGMHAEKSHRRFP
jgi:hypothetical protein